MPNTIKIISIIIPVYNESAGIQQFHNDLLLPEVHKLSEYQFQVIYVDDGSSDNSLTLLKKLSVHSNVAVRVVSLSKNFGKEIATTAGIFHSDGDAAIIMDSDGQHPPKLIGKFIRKWEDGAQVITGVRTQNQKEGFIKKYGSKIFYSLFNRISTEKMTPRSTDFRLIDAEVREDFMTFTERNRITRGLIDWLGYNRAFIEFSAPARIAGEASYSTSQLVRLAVNSFVSLTLKPLFFFGWLGLFIMIISLILGVFIIIEQLLMNDPLGLHITGSAMLGVFIAFMVSLVLTSQAIIAVYMSHIYDQSRARPLFVVNKKNSKNL